MSSTRQCFAERKCVDVRAMFDGEEAKRKRVLL